MEQIQRYSSHSRIVKEIPSFHQQSITNNNFENTHDLVDNEMDGSNERTPLSLCTPNLSLFPGTDRSRYTKRLKVSCLESFDEPKIPHVIGIENCNLNKNLEFVAKTDEKSQGSIDKNLNDLIGTIIEKRKFEIIPFDSDVKFPPRGVLKLIYEHTISTEESVACHDIGDNDSKHITTFDQLYLNEAQILSFESVILPAITTVAENELKKLQARIARDRPHLKPVIIQCRKYIYSAMGSALSAARESRLHRTKLNLIREEQWENERRCKEVEAEQKRLEEIAIKKAQKAQWRELQRLKKQRELKKKLPQNQETWKEVAFLMSELYKLQSDEELWNKAIAEADLWEKEVEDMERSFSKQLQLTRKNENEDINRQNNPRTTSEYHVIDSSEFSNITQCVHEMTLSMTQIEQGLMIIHQVVATSGKVQQDLFEEYTKHHQFRGYQGIHNPKALIFALSQSQDDSEW